MGRKCIWPTALFECRGSPSVRSQSHLSVCPSSALHICCQSGGRTPLIETVPIQRGSNVTHRVANTCIQYSQPCNITGKGKLYSRCNVCASPCVVSHSNISGRKCVECIILIYLLHILPFWLLLGCCLLPECSPIAPLRITN